MSLRLGSALTGTRRVAVHPATRRGGAEWLAWMLFVILVVPAGPNHVLIPMLAVTSALGAFAFLFGGRPQALRSTILGFAIAGAVLAVHGFARSNAGWVDVTIPLLGGPVAWFLISQLGTDWFARRVTDVIALATITISLMVYALNFGVADDAVRWIEPAAFGFRGLGRSRTNLAGITTLIATVPMVASVVLDRTFARVPSRRFALHATALAVSIPAVLLSGRQGLIGALAVFPVLLLVRRLLGFDLRGIGLPAPLRPRARTAVLLVVATPVVALGLTAALDISPVRITQDAFASIGIGDEALGRVVYSADVRTLQSASLLRGFAERPVLGHGAGAVSPEFDTWRGFELQPGEDLPPRPWRAELSYQLLLFEGGIVGVVLYGAAIAFATVRVRRRYRRLDAEMRSILRATIVGSLSILVGAAFNPHLRAVGAQVLLFLPIIVAAEAQKDDRSIETQEFNG